MLSKKRPQIDGTKRNVTVAGYAEVKPCTLNEQAYVRSAGYIPASVRLEYQLAASRKVPIYRVDGGTHYEDSHIRSQFSGRRNESLC